MDRRFMGSQFRRGGDVYCSVHGGVYNLGSPWGLVSEIILKLTAWNVVHQNCRVDPFLFNLNSRLVLQPLQVFK
jgi:hypothetical protein